ncbi:MAG: methyltransferase domain-containing protein [Chloroflexi bacterium]|nr:methyltransferase domain-containing protein [Chloroflexota bacterium]
MPRGRTVDPEMIAFMTRHEADMAFKRRVSTIFDFINPSDEMRILDLPCGRGFYLNMLRHVSQCDLVGADLDWNVVKTAKRVLDRLPKIQIHHASIYAMPYPPDCFDAVILSEVLEHIEDDVRGLQEAFRVLKPGGVLAVTVPNANYPFFWDPINKVLESLFNRHIKHGPLAGLWANHLRLYTACQLRGAVQEAGFLIDDERSLTRHCFPFIHNLVYGLGKPLLESKLLPSSMQALADRHDFTATGSPYNPVKLGVALFNAFDSKNTADEGPQEATVNLAIKGRKPHV